MVSLGCEEGRNRQARRADMIIKTINKRNKPRRGDIT
jgi:hypothetical protein